MGAPGTGTYSKLPTVRVGRDEAEISGSRRDLSDKAISLARVRVRLLPDELEATVLLALLLHCEARHVARRELLICAPSIGATQLFISRETHGPYRKS